MLKKIASISNAGVYRDFQWDRAVLSPGNGRPDVFAPVNIFYGRNYSGKTTLSRIIRSIQTGHSPPKLAHATFSLEFDEGTVTHASIGSSPVVVRVFNEDFVRDNLALFHDDDRGITPFAVLGSENNAIEAEIAALMGELGADDPPSGLLLEKQTHERAVDQAKAAHREAEKALDTQLSAKANSAPHGIKHNPLYREVNYKVPRLEADLEVVLKPEYVPPTEAELKQLHSYATEISKPTIPASPAPVRAFSRLLADANHLLEKRVSPSTAIQSLLNDAVLQAWVRQGRAIHEGKKSHCEFCGSAIPTDLWRRMDEHFNKESEELRSALREVVARLKNERLAFDGWMQNASDEFYAALSAEYSAMTARRAVLASNLSSACDLIEASLTSRMADIFAPQSALTVRDDSEDVDAVHREFEQLKVKSNEHTALLDKSAKSATRLLLLQEVRRFADETDYSKQRANLISLRDAAEALEANGASLKSRISDIQAKMAALRARMKDETRGAERVNELLGNFFGHRALALRSIEAGGQYRFEIWRGNEPASHLSQGERGLVAFCYFVAKLGDIDTATLKPLVWIDDPVSSLDANHVFFLFGLIRYEILRAERCSQLFVSTHSLDFLKFAMQLVRGTGNEGPKCFMIERVGEVSTIKLMPDYFRKQVSEFVYLFHCIYRCAYVADGPDAEELVAGYANNARKFLEIYLSYRYPGPVDPRTRLARFFGENGVGAALLDRIHNEYSHLEGRFERALLPLDVPEMRLCALFILNTIERVDPEQFSAFKAAIGEARATSP